MKMRQLLKCFGAGLLALCLAGCLPIPIIEISPSTPTTGETVSFDGAGSIVSNLPANTVISRYSWDFGDGSAGSGASVDHSYRFAGTYTVSLTVVDSAGREASVEERLTVTAASTTATTDSTDDTETTTTETTTTSQ